MDISNREMVLTSLGFFKNDYQLDNFRSNFGYDWTDEDLNEAIDTHFYFNHSEVQCTEDIEELLN